MNTISSHWTARSTCRSTTAFLSLGSSPQIRWRSFEWDQRILYLSLARDSYPSIERVCTVYNTVAWTGFVGYASFDLPFLHSERNTTNSNQSGMAKRPKEGHLLSITLKFSYQIATSFNGRGVVFTSHKRKMQSRSTM